MVPCLWFGLMVPIEINTIRTVFLVLRRNAGNQGFLLGHDTFYAFHPGSGTLWSDVWTDPYLLKGILQVDGSVLDGTSQDFAYGSPVILSIGTTGNVVANNFSKDRTNASRVWNGDLAEVLIYNELLPVSDMRKIEGYLAHKWSLQGNLVGSHPYKNTPPIPSRPSALAKIYWGGADGGDDAVLWENVIDVTRSSGRVATPPHRLQTLGRCPTPRWLAVDLDCMV